MSVPVIYFNSIASRTWWRHQMETFSALLAFVRGIHLWQVNSPHKGQWHGALVFSLICRWTNGWVNNRDTGDLRHHPANYDVTIMDTDERCRNNSPSKGHQPNFSHIFHKPKQPNITETPWSINNRHTFHPFADLGLRTHLFSSAMEVICHTIQRRFKT